MVSIIRSPTISDHKRKLTPRRSRSGDNHHVETDSRGDVATAPNEAAAGAPLGDSAHHVSHLVEQARLSVLAQFKDEAESARELGRQRGLREGQLSGREEVKKSFADEMGRIRSIADKLRHELASSIHGSEDMIISIAFEALCKVLGDVVVMREGVQAAVRQATARVLDSERLVVRLHPADLSILRSAPGLDTVLSTEAAVSWVEDNEIVLGGCAVETDGGELDARLETQLEGLRAVLLAARASASNSR